MPQLSIAIRVVLSTLLVWFPCRWVSALLAANTIAASGEADARVSLDQQASAAEASDADESADGAAPPRPKDAALVADKDKEPLVRVLSSVDGRSATARATLISDSTASLKAKLKEQNFDDQATPPTLPRRRRPLLRFLPHAPVPY